MTIHEQNYLELPEVSEDGYAMALRSHNFINPTNDPQTRELFFVSLTNAYWRGVAEGVEKARKTVRESFEATSGQKSN